MLRQSAALVAFVTVLGPTAALADETRHERAWEVLNIAHRGASAHAPENTLAAFRLAGDMGADIVELDVQQTRDGKLVIMHDGTLARTTDVEKKYPSLRPWRVGDLTLKQIKKLDAGSWFGRKFKGQRVPTLAEALRTVQETGTGMLLELKHPQLYPGVTGRVISQIRAFPYWTQTGRMTVQSFQWRYVKAVRDNLPSARTAVLGRPDGLQMFGVRWYADAVHPQYRTITQEYTQDVHDQDLDLYAYTVNSEAAMRQLVSYGVDGIVTDRPDALERLALE